ncbi:UNVERIFIED_CONTAM: hypothetical protein PYX00_005237 [Menopon gallinae]|uniref:Uncharacterized protein n=1 Tax=Menopon gallinae TaxID=328185 RepID=A0AAW2HRF8_9NEOP
MKAVKSGQSDVRQALELSNRRELVASSPKIIHQSSRTKKIVDTDDRQESSEVQPDGKVITETRRTTEHEEVCDANVPDDDEVDGRSLDESNNKESFQRFRKTKEADVTEYVADGVKIGQKIHHQAETSEGERYGEPIDFNQMDSLSTRLRRMRLRSQNHKLALEGGSSERKDVLTKKPLNFDQEEETRKVETSKWLEHHFGSESTKSSKGSQDDLADMPSNHNSFINVTMTSRPIRGRSPKTISFSDEDAPPKTYYAKAESPREIFISSPECESPPDGGYFRGIGHWDSRKSQETKTVRTETRKPLSPEGYRAPPESPPLVITSHRINPVPLKTSFGVPPARKEEESSPVQERRTFQTNGTRIPRNSTPVRHDVNFREPSPSPVQRNLVSSPEEDMPSPPVRRKQNRINYEIQSWDKRQKTEERPSYSTRTPSPIEDEIIVREEVKTVDLPSNKKLYQRTRFAADIPPPQQGRVQQPQQPAKQKSKIGESFRKFVGKLRSTSTERKLKKRNGKNGSRSPSPKNTYQNYSVVDNNIPSAVNRVGREHMGEPVAPPRGRPGKSENGSLVDSGTQTKVPGGMERKLTQRYYLGEDPFSGSIYGREREYDGVVPMKTRSRSREQHRPGSYRNREDEIQPSTLGRLSKSTSRLISSEMRSPTYDYDREVQTLPRKLRNDPDFKRPVEAQRSLGETRTLSPNHWEYGQKAKPHSGSMINVSFVNHVAPKYGNGVALNGPAKPARTYRSNLSRSKSFNVQIGDADYRANPYKSNPQLHRLEESPEPLKSPGIISSLNRSSRDVSEGFSYPKEEKRRVFMKGLMERAPELFKTLHGDEEEEEPKTVYGNKPFKARRAEYGDPFRKTALVNGIDRSSPKSSIVSTPSYTQDGNTTRSVVRRGSSGNDDYSETVRITSKSDDPLHPSETNTVQTFTKKTIPSKNGFSTETIESSETKTVVKSRYLGNDGENGAKYYRNGPGGVTIEVRNHRK